jgi:hypothetical protein
MKFYVHVNVIQGNTNGDKPLSVSTGAIAIIQMHAEERLIYVSMELPNLNL